MTAWMVTLSTALGDENAQTVQPAQRAWLAVVADDTGAQYVLPDDRQSNFFNERRITRLITNASHQPQTWREWLQVACTNTGRSLISKPVMAETIDAARGMALAALKGAGGDAQS